jgi:hypothetical protein
LIGVTRGKLHDIILNMKFYVTGRSTNITEVKRVIALIKAQGHQITFDWTEAGMVKPYRDHKIEAGSFAEQGIQGILDADIYLLLAHADGNGVFGELGAALASQQLHGKLRIYGVAREIPEAIFHYHPAIVWKDTVEEVLVELESFHV